MGRKDDNQTEKETALTYKDMIVMPYNIRISQIEITQQMNEHATLLMLHSKVQLLMGLSVQGLMAILSIKAYRKEKRLPFIYNHSKWLYGRRPQEHMIIISNYRLIENFKTGVFSYQYRTSALPLLRWARL